MKVSGLYETLRRSGGINAVSKRLGVSPAVAGTGADALVPAILGGFARYREDAGGDDAGFTGLIDMLESHGGGALASMVLGAGDADADRGNDVLGKIFGSKDVSRSVADHAADVTGIDPLELRRMLPLLAMLVGGYFSARAGGSGVTDSAEDQAGVLGSLLEMGGRINPLDRILGKD